MSKKISEATFGARLFRAAQICDKITNYVGYDPPRTQETAAELRSLINTITQQNDAVALATDNYNAAVTARSNAFHKDTISVMRLLSPISRVVASQYGKASREAKVVAEAIAQIRESNTVKRTNAAGSVGTQSQSAKSFGSLLSAFRALIQRLTNFMGFNPSRFELKITALQAFADSLDTLNQAANTTEAAAATSRALRNALYDDLHDRILRIKNYTSGQYGLKSNEYKEISGLTV